MRMCYTSIYSIKRPPRHFSVKNFQLHHFSPSKMFISYQFCLRKTLRPLLGTVSVHVRFSCITYTNIMLMGGLGACPPVIKVLGILIVFLGGKPPRPPFSTIYVDVTQCEYTQNVCDARESDVHGNGTQHTPRLQGQVFLPFLF